MNPEDRGDAGRLDDLMNADRWREAAALAEANLVDDPSNRDLLWKAGWSRFQMGDYVGAESHLRRAAVSGPASHVDYGALGASLLELARYEEAELWLARALALRDTYLTRICLAGVYHKQGLLDSAEGVHKEGVRLRPNDAKRHRVYADFLSDVGREDEAKVAYERAAALEKGGGD